MFFVACATRSARTCAWIRVPGGGVRANRREERRASADVQAVSHPYDRWS